MINNIDVIFGNTKEPLSTLYKVVYPHFLFSQKVSTLTNGIGVVEIGTDTYSLLSYDVKSSAEPFKASSKKSKKYKIMQFIN